MSLRLTSINAPEPEIGRLARQFHALVEAVGEILFVTTADGRAVEMQAWQDLTGQTEEELLDYGWLRALHPDDVPATDRLWQESLRTGRPFVAEYRIRDRHGRYGWYEARAAVVLDADGARDGWVGICLNIDDLKQIELERARQALAMEDSERRYRSLVQAVAAIVWILPPSGEFDDTQVVWQAYTGQSAAECRGAGWLDAIHSDDRAATVASWKAAFAARTLYEVEHRVRRVDGSWIPMAARAIPIVDLDTGALREWIGFHTDVSRLRRVEAELRSLTGELERRVEQRTSELNEAHRALKAANDGLEQTVEARTAELTSANEEIQRFAYIVSHDLRAPLVNIMGFSNELLSLRDGLGTLVEGLSPEARARLGDQPARLVEDYGESLDFILQSTARMDRLIGAILRLSREGRRAFAPEPIDLRQLLSDIADGLAHQCQTRGARIEVDEHFPPLVADRISVEQILGNIVQNAVKYGVPGRPGIIRISAGATAPEGMVAVAVADNGRGIAPRDHERIFELFRRAGRQDEAGDGIGLAAVRAQTRRLGGAVECRSVEGEGSVFTVTLPRCPRG